MKGRKGRRERRSEAGSITQRRALAAGDALVDIGCAIAKDVQTADALREAWVRASFAARDERRNGERRRADRRRARLSRIALSVPVLLVAAVFLAAAISVTEAWKPYVYQAALRALEAGDEGKALTYLCAVGRHEDAQERARRLLTARRPIFWAQGDTLFAATEEGLLAAGRYAQDVLPEKAAGVVDAIILDTHPLGLREDGTLVSLSRAVLAEAAGWQDVVSIERVYGDVVGLRSDGTLVGRDGGEDVCLSLNGFAALGASGRARWLSKEEKKPETDWENLTDIAGDGSFSIGLGREGNVFAVLNGNELHLGWEGVVAVDAGASHVVALKGDGTVEAIGKNDAGQLNVQGWRDIVEVAAGNRFTAGLRADGTVVVTGTDEYGVYDCTAWSGVVRREGE